ncbi:AcrR family transcriptional regulator [Crossiella equi]|uniref:AcrR family transcriptional regulator n=1 Tax=Crossiella equi TaxID=130796 RepID=A0ABS5AJC3_9PSEU|nr:TetR/AcrR family transcriptional regulator [Crossiella equi]MBP2476673.1 AcrR family transcriptional regulator [Crossiella equi]
MTAPKRVTRRRAETRQRLLDAALAVFAREGFGRSTVEQVCEHAGYTRGAFYSNFASLDELFLAMWEQRSAAMIAEVEAVFERAEHDGVRDVRDMVELLLEAVPLDEGWHRVSAEFTAHALRTPALRRVVTAREEAIAAALTPFVTAGLARLGRVVLDPVALGQAIVAVHDGTSTQCLMDPGDAAVRARRVELFVHVVTAYSSESGE